PHLRVLAQISQACAGAGRPFALCGEMAGDTLGAMALIGLGYRNLSMAPTSLGPVKAMIRSLDLASLKEFLAAQEGTGQEDTGLSPSSGAFRDNLLDCARDH